MFGKSKRVPSFCISSCQFNSNGVSSNLVSLDLIVVLQGLIAAEELNYVTDADGANIVP